MNSGNRVGNNLVNKDFGILCVTLLQWLEKTPPSLTAASGSNEVILLQWKLTTLLQTSFQFSVLHVSWNCKHFHMRETIMKIQGSARSYNVFQNLWGTYFSLVLSMIKKRLCKSHLIAGLRSACETPCILGHYPDIYLPQVNFHLALISSPTCMTLGLEISLKFLP